MAKKKIQEEEVLVDVQQSISKIEKYLEENRKSLSVIVVGILAIVVGYFAVDIFYQQPREKESQLAIYKAQQYFESDSLALALNGNGLDLGFIAVADEYSGTKAGNLANYYAGICALNLGQYQEAIAYFDEFSSDDPILSVIAKGSIGDAFMEINQPVEALEYYNKAVNGEENNLIVPFYLKKAGILAESQGDLDQALKHYTRLKKEFGDSRDALDADKYIARIEIKKAS
tara:strand:- start:1292 stop:1981 length:690 start_codon:yes stop_codon:yes gene_type:complete